MIAIENKFPYFFENSEKDNSYLFEGLNIMEAGENYVSHMGQYPVINLSLKSAKLVSRQAIYAYHGFVVGVLANMHDYIIKSNREGGTGRSDLFIKSLSKRGFAVVIEFKIAKDIDELEKRADDALEQIKEKGYDLELKSEGYKKIIKYGISFYEKDCYVKLGED
ncbi:PD-(D/E)XK nuclease domain-containing protein [Clostridium saccharoperbutylacetonicum]